jgi:tetratricopeptide (TPR) repeat protein
MVLPLHRVGAALLIAIGMGLASFGEEPSRAERPGALDDVTRQLVAERIRYAHTLAQRRAFFAAQQEFMRVLEMIAKGLDADTAREHQRALEEGRRGLDEADRMGQRSTTQAEDLQRYLWFVQQQFALCVGHEPSGSHALHALGHLELTIAEEAGGKQMLAVAKAIALNQAALSADPRNARAANELGVLFARHGRLDDARRVLTQAVSNDPSPEMWHNLAVVYDRQGEPERAKQARSSEQAAAARRRQAGEAGPDDGFALQVTWLEPAEFAHAAAKTTDQDTLPLVKHDAAANPDAQSAKASHTKTQTSSPGLFGGLRNWGWLQPSGRTQTAAKGATIER